MLTVVPGDGSGHEGGKDVPPSLIDEIVREGARRMLAEALQAEVDAYIAAHAAERGEDGRRLVVRNGYHQPREILTSAGAIEVTVPRVNDKRTDPDTGERKRFSSAILPPWARKTPKITEVLPLLDLHGLSSGDFVPALGQFLGSPAGLSAAVITRLTETWKAEQRAFAARDLSAADYVYLWADGIHVNIRLEEHRLCLLVMIGGPRGRPGSEAGIAGLLRRLIEICGQRTLTLVSHDIGGKGGLRAVRHPLLLDLRTRPEKPAMTVFELRGGRYVQTAQARPCGPPRHRPAVPGHCRAG
jgi:hypothetical protein